MYFQKDMLLKTLQVQNWQNWNSWKSQCSLVKKKRGDQERNQLVLSFGLTGNRRTGFVHSLRMVRTAHKPTSDSLESVATKVYSRVLIENLRALSLLNGL